MPIRLLRQLFDEAVRVADPMAVIPQVLPPRPDGRVVVIGAGKASARMAEAVEHAWGPCEGLVITRYGYARPCAGVEIVEAAHPVPDAAGERATARMLALLEGLGEDDFVLALISGGASSLLVAPGPGLTLADKQAAGAALLASGEAIGAMNTVRKHLSRVKGGQLAAMAHPARMLALMISDVPGDDPAAIGSGPTVGEAQGPEAARAILHRIGALTPRLEAALAQSGVLAPGAPRLTRVDNRVVIAPSRSLQTAADLARGQGLQVDLLGDTVEGEARAVARAHAALALSRRGRQRRLLLSGGELTVTRKGDGIGGPNAEYALALALALKGAPGIHAIACDTDGVDGAAEVAGAVIGPHTLDTPGAAEALAANDAHSFFARARGQVVTGPTLTNVNDFRAILIDPVP